MQHPPSPMAERCRAAADFLRREYPDLDIILGNRGVHLQHILNAAAEVIDHQMRMLVEATMRETPSIIQIKVTPDEEAMLRAIVSDDPSQPAKADAEPPTCTLSGYKHRWCGRYLGDNCYCARDRAPGSDWCQQCAAVLGSQA